MNYPANTVVLIKATKCNEARKICQRVEGETIDDFDNHLDFIELNPNDFLVYCLSDFMDLVNNDEINLGEYFITFVNKVEEYTGNSETKTKKLTLN